MSFKRLIGLSQQVLPVVLEKPVDQKSEVTKIKQKKTEAISTDHQKTDQLVWLDLIKAIALIWIILNHVVEQLFGYPYIANPSLYWPPFSERLGQLYPLQGHGLLDIPANLVRYLGWFGDQGVQLFLIASGFGLTWGLLKYYQATPLPLSFFYRKRVARIYPLWWGAHLLFVISAYLTGWGLWLGDTNLYLSLVGIRFTSDLFYFFSPAWWYIGLLLQLYLLYPILWEGLRRRGPWWLLGVSCLVAFTARAFGLLFFTDYMDPWQRGAIFITRLPEFVFGISLAAWLYHAPIQTDKLLRKPSIIILALGVYGLGMFLALTLLGMTIAPFLIGAAMFILLYALLANTKLTWHGIGLGRWLGRHSYSLFLLHHPFILLTVPAGLPDDPKGQVTVGISVALAILLTLVGAVALEGAVNGTLAIGEHWRKSMGIVGAGLGLAAVGMIFVGLLVSAELTIQNLDPQEVIGWGERPALEPHAVFGWRLKPGQTTRLRWESYDYTVTANSLGFPGPEYTPAKETQVYRILTAGDAFTSAEGVDTAQAWPRLLETNLTSQLPNQKIEVSNFAMTGYGPNQYAAVVKEFAPIYRPNLIIIGFFVNDYQDVLTSNEEFQQAIGFGLPAPDSWYVTSRLLHLRRFIGARLISPFRNQLQNQPDAYGYFLGYFNALERDHPEFEVTGRQRVGERLEQIKTVANQIGAKVIVVMIPAPVQICQANALDYYPHPVDLTDSTRFDLNLPQRITQELTEQVGIDYYDLQPTLQTVSDCPYQPRNSHWTRDGHRVVAAYLAERLVTDKFLFRSEP
jgi:peptidoglycan/LPS O-acetylase OafA/YrhL